jgi:BirA family transcriptional regulator, biotin operon repressor / biotin---[acetyl-CoA-carboxylase] ligase
MMLNEVTAQSLGPWTLYHVESIGSTNTACRDLPSWSALRADTQTQGRGRLGRAYACSPGGLWISAVLPADGSPRSREGFSLQVGAALLECLRTLGATGVRLRWPNDLLLGSKKTAGLLIEQPASGKLIVGFGLNVHNTPWEQTPELAGIATRLADWISPPPMDELAGLVLSAIARAYHRMLEGGMGAAIKELNRHWANPQSVELQLTDGRMICGAFVGLDPLGNLRILEQSGSEIVIAHPLVERLRELF